MLEFLDLGGRFQKQVFFEDQIDSTLSSSIQKLLLYCTSAIRLSTKLGFELKSRLPFAFCLLLLPYIYIYIYIHSENKKKGGTSTV